MSFHPDWGTGYTDSFTYDAWNLWSTDDAASTTNQLNVVDDRRGATAYMSLPELTDATGRDYSSEVLKFVVFQTDSAWPGFDGLVAGLTITLTNEKVGEVDLTPEPASLALLSLGAAALLRLGCRRKRRE